MAYLSCKLKEKIISFFFLSVYIKYVNERGVIAAVAGAGAGLFA